MLKTVRIKNLGQIITGNTPPTSKPEYYGNYKLFIKATDIDVNSKFTRNTEECYSKVAYEHYKKSLIPKGSSCVVTIGTVGKKMTMAHCDLFVNQAINAIVPNLQFDNEYVYYLMKYNLFQLKTMDSGTSSGRENISKNAFSNIQVNVDCDIEKQRKIGYILSKYDELIEINNKRIKLLEQTAEELYKEWFVRFRFPNYQNTEFENGIPKGWVKLRLRDFAKESGKTEKKENRNKYSYYIPIDCLSSKSMTIGAFEDVENAESSLVGFCENDILFGAMRPYFHKVTMAPFQGLTRKTCFVISPKNEIYRYYLYLLLFQTTSVDFATTVSVGSTMPYVKWNDFARMTAILPNKEVVEKFNQIVIPMINEINKLYFQNQNLIKQRDLLLPRLMSGKLEVR